MSENVKLDRKSRAPIYSDSSITENGRAAYPIEHIERVVESGVGESPSVVLFLTADAYGVLPPISKLSREEAMFHFLTGYTAKVAGTEVGIVEPTPTFSALFGEPFMPLDHMTYAYLLGVRYEGKLFFSIQAEPSLLLWYLPTLSVLPLVENAVKQVLKDGYRTIDIMPQEEAKRSGVTQVGTEQMGDLICERI